MSHIYLVGYPVVFKRGRDTLQGKILAIGSCGAGERQDLRRVVIATTVTDLGGRAHTGNVTVLYRDIVGLQEREVAP